MTEVAQQPDGVLGGTRAAARDTRDALASVFRNPNLRRIQLAPAGSMIGDWAYATAVAVWAYGVGGATAVGIWTAIRLTLMAVTAPVGALLADRMSRKTVMVGSDVLRAVLVAAAAVCMLADTPAAPIFVLATLAAVCSTPFRSAQRALMPALANRPEELTASNGTSSTLESLAFFVGPALGATLIGLTSIPAVFFLNVLTFGWSALMVLGVTVPARAAAAVEQDGPGDAGSEITTESGPADDKDAGFLTETAAGFRAILADRDLRIVTFEVCAQTVIAGASAVFLVVMAVEILGTGARGVGYLDSVIGLGAIIGGVVAISRSSKQRLGSDMTLGVVLWSLPLVLIGIWPSVPMAFLAVALLGLANPLVDVNMDTIIQRITPDAVLGRVFGALEACLIATMALGAALMPLLLHWLDLRWAVTVLGAAVAAVAVSGLPRIRQLDVRLGRPDGLLLLERIPMFAPLTPATVESLARALVPVEIGAGEAVLHEGSESDRFYVIESGLVEVTRAGEVLRREGPGEFFGEIGLLRDVPRTATITAVEDTRLLALGRDDFLSAVTGQREARLAADDIVTRRLTV